MKRNEMMKALKEMNISFKATMKNEELRTLLDNAKKEESEKKEMKKNEIKEIETRAKKEAKKEEKKVKYTREERLANIASLIANEAYDANLTIKLMSNNSVAIKKDKTRLFRLDLLNKEYQLTSNRTTLLEADERVESVYKKSKDKFFYRFRTTDKNEVIEVMKKTIEMFK